MTKAELIDQLEDLPDDAEVRCVWDGHPRSAVEHVWLSRSGKVILADDAEVVYDTDSRPMDAPTQSEERYWRTPKRET